MSKYFVYVNNDGEYEESGPGVYEHDNFVSSSVGAPDAGKPITLDVDGRIHESFITDSDISHNNVTDKGDDDHTQYILVAGTRPFTGDQDMGGHMLTGLPAPVDNGDATNKEYVDAVATGLRVKGNVRLASTANISIAAAPADLDGVAMDLLDRVLLKDQFNANDNGIYQFNGIGSALTRTEDFDNGPMGEIYNGSFISLVAEGLVNVDNTYVLTSTGTGSNGLHTIGTDDILWEVFSSPTRLTEGQGIDITSNVVHIDLLDVGSGLEFTGSGGAELAIDFATNFAIDANEHLAILCSSVASTASGEGAALVGIEDVAGLFDDDNVEDALYYLAEKMTSNTNPFIADEVLAKGDMVFFSSDGSVSVLDIATNDTAVGICEDGASVGAAVEVMKDDCILSGALVGATAGTKYYWTGSAWSATMPATSGSRVWVGGVAINATDILCSIEFVKRNR